MLSQVLLVLFLFQVKHLVADFFLQSAYILKNRKIYGHPAGLLHVSYHIAGSAIVLSIAGCSLQCLAILLIVEAVVHYHVDWTKDNFVQSNALTTEDTGFWNLLGFDQLLHQSTYIGMAWYFSLGLANV